ncbi:MAG: DJ-1/PfpI family protein [Paludisphaera borealis]|uniref:DJ-1/PfpI family protein n=1 Tax=Paludisphaera borealis TaxID=1387353 RepID=UPI002848BDFE|nr:DJ-1/PfpI family protein [Paludisphaera borealis]MDR3620253.1 DJ-1/PfpI family protein [Paludisphaera borealis]
MSKTILMITGDAGEALEIFYPKHRLEEEDWRVDVAALEKGAIQTVIHDFEPGFATYTEKLGYRIAADLTVDEVRPESYDALILPGGRAPEYLRNRLRVVAITRHFLDAGKPIAATCHAPLILAAAGSLRGRTLTCYPELEPDVRAAGGLFVNREVVIDDNLVTARAWPDNGPWMREFVRLLKSPAKAT